MTTLSSSPIHLFEIEAKRRLEPTVWRYLQEGAGRQITVQANESAWQVTPLMPRPLVRLQQASSACQVLGDTLEHPILLAPVAYQRLFHVDGECASAMAANAQGGQMLVSSLASQTLESIIESAGQSLWFQLYWQGDRERTKRLLNRAIAAGYRTVVFTVDAPVKQAGLILPEGVSAVNLEQPLSSETLDSGVSANEKSQVFAGWMAQAPDWNDVQWLREQVKGKLLIKGLLHIQDVASAVQCGVDGVIVSNHGGRVLDQTPTVPAVFPAIAKAFGDQLTLIVDSGLRTGTDIYQALAMGADAVMIGRPYIWGLAANGAMGVAQVIRCLRDELEMTMALTGVSRLSEMSTFHRWQ